MANCAIVGINWGDEGKGRMVDYLTNHFDVVVPIMEIMATKMDAIMASIIMAIIERELAAQEDTASALAAAATV